MLRLKVLLMRGMAVSEAEVSEKAGRRHCDCPSVGGG